MRRAWRASAPRLRDGRIHWRITEVKVTGADGVQRRPKGKAWRRFLDPHRRGGRREDRHAKMTRFAPAWLLSRAGRAYDYQQRCRNRARRRRG